MAPRLTRNRVLVSGVLVLLAALAAYCTVCHGRRGATSNPAFDHSGSSATAPGVLRGSGPADVTRPLSASTDFTDADAQIATIQVVDTMGRGVPRARVFASFTTARGVGSGASPRMESLTADDAGAARVVIPGPRGAIRCVVAAEATEPPRCAAAVAVRSGSHSVLILEAAGRIRGRVRAPAGAAVGAAIVYASSGQWPDSPGRRVLPTTVDGEFVLEPVRAEVGLYATIPGFAPSAPWRGRPRDGRTMDVELVVGPAALSVAGSVRRDDGAMLPPGTSVLFRGGSRAWMRAAIEDEGFVRFSGVEAGAGLDVVLYPVWDPATQQWVTPGGTFSFTADKVAPGHVDIRVPIAARPIEFWVRDANGSPVANLPLVLTVAVERDDPLGSSAADVVGWRPPADRVGRTDSSGGWRPFEDGPARVGRATLYAAGRLRLWDGALSLPVRADSGGIDRVDVRLADAETVELHLVDAAGTPLKSRALRVSLDHLGPTESTDAGAPVPEADFGESSIVTLVADRKGPSQRLLRVRENGAETQSQLVDVTESRVLTLRPSPERGAVSFGLATADGIAVPVHVAVTAGPASRVVAVATPTADANGRSVAIGLLPGRYSWRASRPGADDWSGEEGCIDIRAAEMTRVDLPWQGRPP